MKGTINKLDYSSYHKPYIDEFVPGLEYEYVKDDLVSGYCSTLVEKHCYFMADMLYVKCEIILIDDFTYYHYDLKINTISHQNVNHINYIKNWYKYWPGTKKFVKLEQIDDHTLILRYFPAHLCLSKIKEDVFKPYKPKFKGTYKIQFWEKEIWSDKNHIHTKNDIKNLIKKDAIIVGHDLFSYHEASVRGEMYDFIVVSYPYKKKIIKGYYCESIKIKSNNKKFTFEYDYWSEKNQYEFNNTKTFDSYERVLEFKEDKNNLIVRPIRCTCFVDGQYEKTINYLKGNTNLEEKPMKRSRIRKTYEVLVKPKKGSPFKLKIEGDLDLQISKEGGSFYNVKPIYNKAKGMHPKAEVIVMKEVDDIIKRLKKQYKEPRVCTFQVSWSKGGFDEKGLPKFQITNTIHGTSYKNALKKHKISIQNVLWAKEIRYSMRKDPEIISLYERTFPFRSKVKINKAKKRRFESIKKRNIKKLHDISQRIQSIHNSDKLVCIRFKDTVNVERIPKSKTVDGTYNMEEWHYISKSTYKKFSNYKERIEPPKPNQEKQMEKNIAKLDKKKNKVLTTHKQNLIKQSNRKCKGHKKIKYRIKGEPKTLIYYGGKKRKACNNKEKSRRNLKQNKRNNVKETNKIQ